jgi:hypothetical protein
VRKRMMRLGMERKLDHTIVSPEKAQAASLKEMESPEKARVASLVAAQAAEKAQGDLLVKAQAASLVGYTLPNSPTQGTVVDNVTRAKELKPRQRRAAAAAVAKAAKVKAKEDQFMRELEERRKEAALKKEEDKMRLLLKTPQRGTQRKGAGVGAGAGKAGARKEATVDWTKGWYGAAGADGEPGPAGEVGGASKDGDPAHGRRPGSNKVDFADRPSSKRARTPLVRWKDEQREQEGYSQHGEGGRDYHDDDAALPSLVSSASAPATTGTRKGKSSAKSIWKSGKGGDNGSRLPRLGDKKKATAAEAPRPCLRLVCSSRSSSENDAGGTRLPDLIDLLSMARSKTNQEGTGAGGLPTCVGGDEVTIGRSSRCDVQLDTCDSCMLSKVHATLTLEKQSVLLMDLGSRNGTYLTKPAAASNSNSEEGIEVGGTVVRKLKPKEAISISAGDVVLFGSRPSRSRRTNGTEAKYELVYC